MLAGPTDGVGSTSAPYPRAIPGDMLWGMCSVGRIGSWDLRAGMALFARLILALAIASICHAQEERKPIQNPAPAYPTFARHISLTGTVKVKAIIGPDGLVKQVEVVGGHPLLWMRR